MTQTQIHMLADATHTRCIEDEKDDTYHQIYRAYVYELRNAYLTAITVSNWMPGWLPTIRGC